MAAKDLSRNPLEEAYESVEDAPRRGPVPKGYVQRTINITTAQDRRVRAVMKHNRLESFSQGMRFVLDEMVGAPKRR